MGGFNPFRRPSNDAAAQAAAQAEQARSRAEAEAAKLKKENDARLRNLKSRRRGRSLLAYHETGERGVGRKLKQKIGD
ncbi:MAG: hypothetical protein AAF442_08105 [Pseudomonadota bacterium]